MTQKAYSDRLVDSYAICMMQGRDNKWRLSFWEKTFIFAIVHGFCKANVDIALKSRVYSVEFVAGYFLSV